MESPNPSQIAVSPRPGTASGSWLSAQGWTPGDRAGLKRNRAHSPISNAGLAFEDTDPSTPSKCQRGRGRLVVVLISTIPTAPPSKSISDAGEVIAVAAPDIAAELREDAQRPGRVHQPPDLVNEVAPPVVEPAAAESRFVAPVGAVSRAAGPTQLENWPSRLSTLMTFQTSLPAPPGGRVR